MFLSRHARRVATAALAAVAFAVGGFTQPATAALGDVTQQFSLDSGDRCPMGLAKGVLIWHLAPADRSVDGKADLRDRPDPDETSTMCPDDRRYSVLIVTARAADGSSARALIESDNGLKSQTFKLSLTTRIEQVVLQICRRGPQNDPVTYCGPAQTHRAPITAIG